MLYGLLGELEIRADGHSIALPGGRSRVLLAALLINANQQLSKAQLMRAAWGRVQVGEAQLPKHVKVLRDLLATIGRDDIKTYPRVGYELRVADDELDMLLFNRLAREARDVAGGGHENEEIAVLRRALSLWRGSVPLANVPGNTFRRDLRPLVQRRRRVAARLFDLEMARGGHDRIVDELTRLADTYPDDPRLCEQSMVVLQHRGYPDEALRAYERHALALERDHAGSPDALLRRYKHAILNGRGPEIAEVQALLARRAGMPARGAAAVLEVPRQLPAEPAGFVGRDDLAAEAGWLLERTPERPAPVLVVSGPGGIGKTALIRRVAQARRADYPDGQLFAELRGAQGEPYAAGDLLGQFLRAFGVPVVPENADERAAAYRTLLSERRVLVVLDDAADEDQVRSLLPAGPGCGVLVSSRRRLPDLEGVHHLPPLEPLPSGPARELLLGVVRAAGIAPTAADDKAVDQVLQLCAGLPLALRIAGALWVRDYPQPAANLADRLRRQGTEAFEYGPHSLIRTIGAGFDRLDAGSRWLFLGLGQLRTPTFGLWTAAAVLEDTGVEPVAALSQLAASNMIEVLPADVRYRFHDLTRDYAVRRARVEGGDQTAPERAYRALLTLLRRAHAALYGGPAEVVHSDVPDWDAPASALAEVDSSPGEWFEKERRGIRAAVEHCAELGRADLCWDLAVSAHEFYTRHEQFDDWYATHTVALRACVAAGDRRGEGVILASLGQPALVASGRVSGLSGVAELRRAVDLLAGRGDEHGLAIAERTLGNALRRRARLAEPLQWFRAALDHYTAAGDEVGQWQTRRFIGQTHLDRGDAATAVGQLHDVWVTAVQLGEARLVAQARYWLGMARLAADDVDGAREDFAAVLAAYPEADGIGHAYALHGVGDVARRTGDLAAADRRLTAARELAHDGADAGLEGRVLLSLAALAEARRQPDQQVSFLRAAAQCFAGCGATYLEIRAQVALARAHEGRGDTEAAQACRAWVEQTYASLAVPPEDRI